MIHRRETDFRASNNTNREGTRHTLIVRCHHKYVTSIRLKEQTQSKLLLTTSIIVTSDQIALQLEGIEGVLVDRAIGINATVTAEREVSVERDVDPYGFVEVFRDAVLIPRKRLVILAQY